MNPDDQPEAMEDREVRVSDPHLSDSANARLTEEVREVIGTDHVNVSRDRPHPSQGERSDAHRAPFAGSSINLILIIMALLLLVLGALLTALTGSWWFAGLALVVDALGGAAIIASVLQMTGVREHADASTAALLEEEGVSNPDQHLSDLVAEFTEAHREGAAGNQRLTAVEDDAVAASAEQAGAMTPSGGRSRPVGPGEEDVT